MMSMAFASVSSGRGKALVSNRSAMSRVSSGVFFQAQPGQGDKQMSQGHQAHVMMPTRPRPRFVPTCTGTAPLEDRTRSHGINDTERSDSKCCCRIKCVPRGKKWHAGGYQGETPLAGKLANWPVKS